MSEASRRSRVTITLGRSGQVVSRDGSELDDGYELLPRAGTKRSVKERLGNQIDSSIYGNDVVSKRQRGEASFSGNDLQISKNDLRFKLLQKNSQKRSHCDEGSSMDLRAKLSSRNEQPPRSLDIRSRMGEPRDDPVPSSRAGCNSSQMLSSSRSYSPWALDDIRRRSPERFEGTSRGLSPPRNARSVIGIPRDLSPTRHARSFIGSPRDPSPPRNARSFIGSPRDLSPPRNARSFISTPRDLSPPRNSGRIFSAPRALSPPRNAGRITDSRRALSPPGTAGRVMGIPRDLSPPRHPRSFSGGSRALSPTRNVGSYMGSSREFSPPRNPGSFMGSSRGSPPPRNIEDLYGRNKMLDDARASFHRRMLPPPVPNPHPLPPLNQLLPRGTMMQNSPFPVEEPLTVERFLDSLGLGRYILAFKREEVDMSTIKQMKESDLKDLIIPMGPRKKILQAIACLPK